MAGWREILEEIKKDGDFDKIRRKYLKGLNSYTQRNVIAYYSGWLQKPGIPSSGINDFDKNSFMTTIKGLDRSKGLDLILHTPGGEVAATESIIDYLCSMFKDIRVIVPQLAMSGGTMIACSSNMILMGKHSSLGPIDPQIYLDGSTVPAHGIIEEFEDAYQQIKKEKDAVYIWQPILAKYRPTLVGECRNALNWAEEIVDSRLKERMLKRLSKERQEEIIGNIKKELSDHSVSLSHARHFSAKKCKEMGLKIEMLEKDQNLQDKVLSIHHAMMHTLASTMAIKIVENHEGSAVVLQIPNIPKK